MMCELHADDEARTNKHSPSLLLREEGPEETDLQVRHDAS